MNQTYLQNLRNGLFELFEKNDSSIIIGEDIIDPYGGAFKVTNGLSTKYPERVIATPISEASIVGLASGLALKGYNPIVEIMFGDFMTLCADQLINHASKFPLMYQNTKCPLIVRTPMGGGRGYGPTHSQSLEKMFFGFPGLKSISPSLFHQPGKTLNRISECESGPVIFVENKLLYAENLINENYENKINKMNDDGYDVIRVDNFNFGFPDVTIIAYGGASRFIPSLLATMKEEEIKLSAIIPECIDPLPFESITKLISFPTKLIILDEGYATFNWASEVSSKLYDILWGKISAPIRVVTSARQIIPTSFDQEMLTILTQDQIETSIFEELQC